MAKTNLTAQQLRDELHYDPDTGLFTRLKQTAGARLGATAGCIRSDKYRWIWVCGDKFGAHRLAFLYMTDRWPTSDVDHINGDRSDNRWENLRSISREVNAQNFRRAIKSNSTGLLGVSKAGNRFRAIIQHNGVRLNIGFFKLAEEAHAAYLEAKRRLHPGCTI